MYLGLWYIYNYICQNKLKIQQYCRLKSCGYGVILLIVRAKHTHLLPAWVLPVNKLQSLLPVRRKQVTGKSRLNDLLLSVWKPNSNSFLLKMKISNIVLWTKKRTRNGIQTSVPDGSYFHNIFLSLLFLWNLPNCLSKCSLPDSFSYKKWE